MSGGGPMVWKNPKTPIAIAVAMLASFFAVNAAGRGVAKFYQNEDIATKSGTWAEAKHGKEHKPSGPVMDPEKFLSFPVSENIQHTHDTHIIKFKSNINGALPIASHLLVKAPIGEQGKDVVRPYTPIDANPETVTLLVKDYHEKGVMSHHICSLKPGDSIEVKGPRRTYDFKTNTKKHVGFVAGGTGITPALQIVKEILENREDTTVSLVFANHTEKDILMQDELDNFKMEYPGRFQISYVLSRPSQAWKGFTGHVSQEILDSTIPKPSADSFVFVCGPPGFMEAVSGRKNKDYSQGDVSGILKAMGFTKDMVYKL